MDTRTLTRRDSAPNLPIFPPLPQQLAGDTWVELVLLSGALHGLIVDMLRTRSIKEWGIPSEVI